METVSLSLFVVYFEWGHAALHIVKRRRPFPPSLIILLS